MTASQGGESAEGAAVNTAIAERIIGHLVQVAGNPVVSPNGHWVAFTVARVDLERNTTVTQVWMAAADGASPPRPVTGGEHDGNPAFSPDSRTLVFTSRRSPAKAEATLHALAVDAPGETRTLATMPDGVGGPAVSPDGRWVAFTSRTQDERYRAQGAADGDARWQSPRKIERFFTRLNGEGWVFDRPQHVYLVPLDGTAAPATSPPATTSTRARAGTPTRPAWW